MQDLRSYSEMRIGVQWTQTDHAFVITTLAAMDALTQSAFNQRVIEADTRRARKELLKKRAALAEIES